MKADEKTIAALIACLKELPDGTEITTGQLLKAAGFMPDGRDFEGMMDIHFALFDAADKEFIDLDMSKHESKVEGLPYNLDFKVTHLGEEYKKGFAAGRAAAQPRWISVEDELPEEDGDYYTITELQHDTPAAPKGTISIDVSENWRDGQWWQDDENWKVLYWAKPIVLDVPEELAGRPRLGCI